MDFEGLLLKKRSGIVKKWIHFLENTYEPETSTFLKTNKDRFANPVGAAIHTQIESLFDALISAAPSEEISRCLDKIIRIRAVQDFTPSQAVGFILPLKQIIKDELKKEIAGESTQKRLVEIESRIDSTALLAFDIYMSCREKIHQIKQNELRKMGFSARDGIRGSDKDSDALAGKRKTRTS